MPVNIIAICVAPWVELPKYIHIGPPSNPEPQNYPYTSVYVNTINYPKPRHSIINRSSQSVDPHKNRPIPDTLRDGPSPRSRYPHVHYFLVKQWLTLTVSLWMRHTSKQRITTVVFGTRQIDRFDQENSEYNECENPLQSNNLDRELLDGQCCSNQPVHL